jgi:hypothetical protein
MNGPNDALDQFSRWFDRLVRNKMGGPALCVAGMSIGYSFVQLTRFTPAPYADDLGQTGTLMIRISSLMFSIAMVGFCLIWLWAQAAAARRRR